jgi:hypothetical protein
MPDHDDEHFFVGRDPWEQRLKPGYPSLRPWVEWLRNVARECIFPNAQRELLTIARRILNEMVFCLKWANPPREVAYIAPTQQAAFCVCRATYRRFIIPKHKL